MKKKKIFIIGLFVWIALAFVAIYSKLPGQIKRSLYFAQFSSHEKYFLIDGNFYKIVLLCQTEIPPYEPILLEPYENVQEFSGSWYRKEYILQKAPYYFYPRIIVGARHPGKREETHYRIVFNKQADKFRLYQDNQLLYADF